MDTRTSVEQQQAGRDAVDALVAGGAKTKGALAMLAALTDAYACFYAARDLHARARGQALDTLRGLLERVVATTEDGVPLVPDEPASLRLAAARLACRSLPPADADAVLDRFREQDNAAVRLAFHKLVAAELGARAVPRIVLALAERVRGRRGGVTPTSYLVELLSLLRGHDVSAHRARLARLRARADRPVREALDALQRGSPVATAAPAAPKTSVWAFDAYGARVLASATRALAATDATLPSAINRALLCIPEGGLRVTALALVAEESEHRLPLRGVRARLPRTLDDVDDVLDRWRVRHHLEPDHADAPAWGDAHQLPLALLLRELVAAAAPLCHTIGCARAGVRLGDAEWFDATRLDAIVHRRLRALPAVARAELVAICIAGAARRSALLAA